MGASDLAFDIVGESRTGRGVDVAVDCHEDLRGRQWVSGKHHPVMIFTQIAGPRVRPE